MVGGRGHDVTAVALHPSSSRGFMCAAKMPALSVHNGRLLSVLSRGGSARQVRRVEICPFCVAHRPPTYRHHGRDDDARASRDRAGTEGFPARTALDFLLLHEGHSTCSSPCSSPPAWTSSTWSAASRSAGWGGTPQPGQVSPCSRRWAATTAARRLRSAQSPLRAALRGAGGLAAVRQGRHSRPQQRRPQPVQRVFTRPRLIRPSPRPRIGGAVCPRARCWPRRPWPRRARGPRCPRRTSRRYAGGQRSRW